MQKINKGVEPPKLKTYRDNTPQGTWERFSKKKSRREEVQQSLYRDQGGLCAYCEIDLKKADTTGQADFRVEHFHPKSDDKEGHNWHLDWQNLLACCHGGSRADIVDAAHRHTSPDHSCDVPKADHDWDSLILNPLQLPASPALFQFSRSNGSIAVNIPHCQAAEIHVVQAQNTIAYLRLDAPRLKTLRKAELDRVNDLLRRLVNSGMTLTDAKNKLRQALLKQDDQGQWPKFVSALRDYLK